MTDEPIVIGAQAAADVTCSKCRRTLPGSEAHVFRGKKGEDVHVCPECKRQIDEAFRAETEDPNYLGAVVMGLAGGIAGGALWYLVEILTGYRVGYVALAVGFLVGWGVILGSGKKRGGTLQLISVGITLFAVLGASYFSAIHFTNDYLREQVSGAAYVWISPFDPGLIKAIVSPMGVFIWAIGAYIGFRTPQARKL
ncbi:MAG TPA: hypothetical protein VLJ16_06115 [Acidobacteriota bacterium]|nr:hypothetical protein [Acidobacteriota bacterium]